MSWVGVFVDLNSDWLIRKKHRVKISEGSLD